MADALASMREVASYSPAVSMARLLEQIDDVPPPGYLPKASRLARVARPGGGTLELLSGERSSSLPRSARS